MNNDDAGDRFGRSLRRFGELCIERAQDMSEHERRELLAALRSSRETLRSATQEARAPRERRSRGELEVKRTRLLEMKRALASVGTEGRFTGYGSKFDEPHQTSSWMLSPDWMDVVAPGSFKKTLAEHRSRTPPTMPAMLLQHDMSSLPIGVWREVREDGVGLYVEGELALATDKGAEVYELMKLGAMDGLSIGFMPTKFALDEKKKLRTITEIDLWEISPVTIPGDPGARVEDVKGVA